MFRKKLRLLFYIIFIMLFYPAIASVWDNEVSVENINTKLPELNNIKCNFRQEKIISNIDKPFISTGKFEFIKNKGIYFYTEYPIKSTIDYTCKNYKYFNDIIMSVSLKKYSKLEKEFKFYFQSDNDKWIVGLKPKENSEAGDFIYYILIEGNNYISKIVTKSVNNNKTTIYFYNPY